MRNIGDYASEPRRYQRMLDLRFGVRYNLLHERLYGRMGSVLAFVQGFAGAGAFAGFVADRPAVAGIGGLIAAAAAVIDSTLSPRVRAARFGAQRERYSEIEAIADALGLDDLDRRLAITQARVQEGEIDALRTPAQNDTLIENGRDDAVLATTRLESLLAALT
jgi:hypothetical protein